MIHLNLFKVLQKFVEAKFRKMSAKETFLGVTH